MKNLETYYSKIFLGNSDKFVFGAMIIFLFGFSYSIFFLFNRPADPAVEQKIMQESQSVNVNFDTETIKMLSESKNYGTSLSPTTEGKNPFVTY